MTNVAVTDTHALIWHATGVRRRLGRQARRLFERADAGNAAVYVPTIVLVELSENIRAGRLILDRPFADWEADLFSSGAYVPVDLTRAVVRSSEQLYGIAERGDRLIAATAICLECPLITRDPALASVAGLELVW